MCIVGAKERKIPWRYLIGVKLPSIPRCSGSDPIVWGFNVSRKREKEETTNKNKEREETVKKKEKRERERDFSTLEIETLGFRGGVVVVVFFIRFFLRPSLFGVLYPVGYSMGGVYILLPSQAKERRWLILNNCFGVLVPSLLPPLRVSRSCSLSLGNYLVPKHAPSFRTISLANKRWGENRWDSIFNSIRHQSYTNIIGILGWGCRWRVEWFFN